MLRQILSTALVSALATTALDTTALADVRCAKIFGDHMVLQRETEVAVWGWGDPGEHVTVTGSWSDGGRVTVTGRDGRWSLKIATPVAGGPHTLSVKGNNELTFSDVLIGEVWVCSGQSNMEWAVRSSDNPEEEIKSANHPNLRIFDVGRAISMEPVEDVSGSWSAVTPETIPGFSAVGYFFGREVQAQLGIPVGLIGSNWGGTVAESWTSREGLASFPEFTEKINAIDSALEGGGEDTLGGRQAQWWHTLNAKDPGMREGWMKPGVDTASWTETTLPGLFKDFGHGDFDGCMWYRRSVTVPAAWAGKDLVLELGPVDDMDITYFNGEEVGAMRQTGKWQTPRVYSVPAAKVHAGRENLISVLCLDTGGGGAIGLNTAMRLRPKDSERAVDLSGAWHARPGVKLGDLGSYPSDQFFHANYVTALHNGMIAPIVPYGIRGALWYQGESNRGRAAQYRRVFSNMIEDWRRKWGIGDFSFYFVQLAPYHYNLDAGELAELREAQTLALALPNTGMAVTMDVGNVRDIHPRNKQDVGKRLALWALAKDYGQDVVFSGPLYRAMVVVGSSARLHFDHGQGLRAEGGAPTNFTLAGADGVFHPASARIDGATIVVTCEAVPQPAAVRYCWGTDDEGNLFNGAGLPASSFRSDAWPPVSSWR